MPDTPLPDPAPAPTPAPAPAPTPDEAARARLGRITFRAWRRGFREADMVLGPFVEQVGPTLSDAELTDFEALIAQDNDYDLYAWIIEAAPTPDVHQTPLMDKLRAFVRVHVAHEVARGIG